MRKKLIAHCFLSQETISDPESYCESEETKNYTELDSGKLLYWGQESQSQNIDTTYKLLEYKDGRCTAWERFFQDFDIIIWT